MKKVKIKPDAHTNHRTPHVPWYINRECNGLASGIQGLVLAVLENDTDSYDLAGFWFGDIYVPARENCAWIYKKDCVEI